MPDLLQWYNNYNNNPPSPPPTTTTHYHLRRSCERGDNDLISQYTNHALGYTPNGGSADLRADIAALYGPNITPEHVLVFAGAQVSEDETILSLPNQMQKHDIPARVGCSSNGGVCPGEKLPLHRFCAGLPVCGRGSRACGRTSDQDCLASGQWLACGY